MQDNPRLTREEIEQMRRRNAIGLDEEFVFGCNQCGGCCNMDDVVLNPRDLFRAVKYLKMDFETFVEENCHYYIGPNSKIPFFRLLVDEEDNLCALYNEKCIIHPVKPVACALYPLARGLDENGDFTYFTTDEITCGNRKQKQTVREWLHNSGLDEGEAFSKYWMKESQEIGKLLSVFWNDSCSREDLTYIYDNTATILYMDYDLDLDPISQIEENIRKIKEALKEIWNEMQ